MPAAQCLQSALAATLQHDVVVMPQCAGLLPQWQLRSADCEASHACRAVEHPSSAVHHTALRHVAKVDVARAQRQLLACRTAHIYIYPSASVDSLYISER
jgi:hypothetical protein